MQYLNKPMAAICLAVASAFVQAQEATYDFNIPAQSASQVLNALSKQTGLQPFFTEDSVKGVQSPGVKGKFSLREALGKALAGTGLSYQFTAEKAVAIKLAPAEKVAQLATIEVKGEAEKGYAVKRASTATKTDTPIMETPVSIQVVPQQVLQDQQVVRLEKSLQNVSGVLQHPAGQGVHDTFIVRGFQANTVYRDGFPLPYNGHKREVANLEQVEVLKGPGSILYGRTEPGGVINLVTKQPLATPYYSIQQQIGSFDFYRTSVDATGPLTQDDTLLYRVNLSYENAGSFRDFVDSERFFIAPVLKWNISPRTQATLEFEYQKFDEPQDPGIPPIGNRPAQVPRERFGGEPLQNKLKGDRLMAGFHWSHEINDDWSLRQRFTTERINYDTLGLYYGPTQANGTMIRRFFNQGSGSTVDFERYYTSLDLTGKVSTGALKHTLLFGFDYSRAEDSYLSAGCCDKLAPAFNIFNPVYMSTPLVQSARVSTFSTSQSSYGLYLQDQIELPYNLFALAGLRYDNAKGSTNAVSGNSVKDDQVSPRAGLLWRPIPWLSLYGSYTENFGAANSLYNTDGKYLPPQTAQQWEAGVKTELLDGRLSATLSYFDLTKQNIAVTDYSTPSPLTQTIGEAKTRGLEFDVAGQVLPGWQVIGAYTFMPFAEVTKDVGSDGGIGNQGKRLFQAPRHAASIWNTYEFQGGEIRGLKLGAGVVAVGQREGNLANTYQLPGYAIVNLLASYPIKMGQNKITAQLNVDNLLDKTYYVGSNSGNFITFGAPRTFMGSLKVEF